MWSRVRHRRLQALALVLLAALLSTSVGLGPLYQRAMEQALAGSLLDNATPAQRALRITGTDLTADRLESELPERVAPYVEDPEVSRTVDLKADTGRRVVKVRLYAVDDACARLDVQVGRCPEASGEILVSDRDVEVNGWQVGQSIDVEQQVDAFYDGGEGPVGTLTVVGVYDDRVDDDWLSGPLTDRSGLLQEGDVPISDDWVTIADTFVGSVRPTTWYKVVASVVWPVDRDAVDADSLPGLGAAVEALQRESRTDGSGLRVDSSLATLADRLATGREQGRTTVVVLAAQLLVLVVVVLWMVLCAATDDRRPELALARLRGRGRRGAAGFLLAELVPLGLIGVGLGLAAAPLVMAAVSRVVFPVPVPVELTRGFVLAGLGAVAVVLLVVLAAARRAVREPLDSLLRAVPARRGGGAVGEVVAVVFSLTAVVALVTGNLEGPLATLAPTLLAVAAGLLLARALGPVTLAVSRRLLQRGRAVAAAGILTAVRRPSARRVLVMVVVAGSLVVFCADALVTGQHNRQNAAEQEVGAPYALSVRAESAQTVRDAVASVDPDHRHATPVVVSSTVGTGAGPTVAVDPVAFERVASFPLGGSGDLDVEAIRAPQVAPVRLTGTRLTGAVDLVEVGFGGPSRRRDDVSLQAQLQRATGTTTTVDLAALVRGPATAPIDLPLDCADGCVLTGLTLSTPPGLRVLATLVLRDLAVDGTAVDLGSAQEWGTVTDTGGKLSATDPDSSAGSGLGLEVDTDGAAPPVLLHAWVPHPVPALVTSREDAEFDAPGLETPVAMAVAGTVPRLPGAAPGARLVDLEGLLRQPDVSIADDVVEVWTDSAAVAAQVTTALRERGVAVDSTTTTVQVRTGLDASPAAWSLALSVLVGGAAVLVAALVMLVSTATSWRSRATDLAALRMAGLPDRSLRRLELLGQLPVVVVGALTGAVCGVAAAALALPGVRQFTVVPDVDTTDFATPWPTVALTAVIALLLLSVLAVGTSRWTARRARLARIREAV